MLRALQGMGRGAQCGEGPEAGSWVWGVHVAIHRSPEGMGPLNIKSHVHSVNLPLRQEPVFTADEGCKKRRGEYVSLFAPWLLLQQREVEGGSRVPPAPLAPAPLRGFLSNAPWTFTSRLCIMVHVPRVCLARVLSSSWPPRQIDWVKQTLHEPSPKHKTTRCRCCSRGRPIGGSRGPVGWALSGQ